MAHDGGGRTVKTLTAPVVFVYGALRSGTTLLRLMLEAHSGITNAGEADFLFDHILRDPSHPTGWRYDLNALQIDRIFLDTGLNIPEGKDGLDLLADFLAQFATRAPGKVVTLNLHRHAERLIQILPQARLIHILRDPRDVARSSIGMGWAGTLYHGANYWIATEESWDRIAGTLAPGQTFTLKYETVFTDVAGALAEVCAFLGLAYDPGMLNYHKSTTYGPPDTKLVEQWRHLSTRAELAPLEARVASLMTSRGYRLSGPVTPAGTLQKVRLDTVNLCSVWWFGIRRFGFGLYIGEKLVRRLPLPAMHHRVRARMNAITVKHLK